MAYTTIFELWLQNHTVTQINSYLNGQPWDRKLMQVGRFLPRTGLIGLAKFSVNSMRIMYKQYRQLRNVKNPYTSQYSQFYLSLYSLPNFRSFPQGKERGFPLLHLEHEAGVPTARQRYGVCDCHLINHVHSPRSVENATGLTEGKTLKTSTFSH
jgi:hypothetical protein